MLQDCRPAGVGLLVAPDTVPDPVAATSLGPVTYRVSGHRAPVSVTFIGPAAILRG